MIIDFCVISFLLLFCANHLRASACPQGGFVWSRFSHYNMSSHPLSLRLVHNTTLNNALHCVVFASTLVETQHDARIDLDPILAFPCVAFLCLVVKNPPTFLAINLCVSRINAMQGLASLCEPAFSHLPSCLLVFKVLFVIQSITVSVNVSSVVQSPLLVYYLVMNR